MSIRVLVRYYGESLVVIMMINNDYRFISGDIVYTTYDELSTKLNNVCANGDEFTTKYCNSCKNTLIMILK